MPSHLSDTPLVTAVTNEPTGFLERCKSRRGPECRCLRISDSGNLALPNRCTDMRHFSTREAAASPPEGRRGTDASRIGASGTSAFLIGDWERVPMGFRPPRIMKSWITGDASIRRGARASCPHQPASYRHPGAGVLVTASDCTRRAPKPPAGCRRQQAGSPRSPSDTRAWVFSE